MSMSGDALVHGVEACTDAAGEWRYVAAAFPDSKASFWSTFTIL
jgi:hypothetical protein